MTTTQLWRRPTRTGAASPADREANPARVRRREVALYSVLGVVALVAGTLGTFATFG